MREDRYTTTPDGAAGWGAHHSADGPDLPDASELLHEQPACGAAGSLTHALVVSRLCVTALGHRLPAETSFSAHGLPAGETVRCDGLPADDPFVAHLNSHPGWQTVVRDGVVFARPA